MSWIKGYTNLRDKQMAISTQIDPQIILIINLRKQQPSMEQNRFGKSIRSFIAKYVLTRSALLR
jgi:hypothetical protein